MQGIPYDLCLLFPIYTLWFEKLLEYALWFLEVKWLKYTKRQVWREYAGSGPCKFFNVISSLQWTAMSHSNELIVRLTCRCLKMQGHEKPCSRGFAMNCSLAVCRLAVVAKPPPFKVQYVTLCKKSTKVWRVCVFSVLCVCILSQSYDMYDPEVFLTIWSGVFPSHVTCSGKIPGPRPYAIARVNVSAGFRVETGTLLVDTWPSWTRLNAAFSIQSVLPG